MGENVMRSLCISMEQFWEEYDVANRLVALEMLKDQYAKYVGNTWNVLQMHPLQRTLPLRMRYKEMKLRYLDKQLVYQDEQLKTLMGTNVKNRSCMKEIEELRKSVLLDITSCTKDMEQMNSLMVQLSCDLISILEKD